MVSSVSSGTPLRLGAVPYLNGVPLLHGLDSDPLFEIVRDRPARLASRLQAGEVDVALIPVAEYDDRTQVIVPGMGIVSRGAVRSVRLFLGRPLRDVRRVALDVSSRSSRALVQLILRERLPAPPEYIDRPPDVAAMLEEADAALLIGDAALYSEAGIATLDLGEEWLRLSGRPFVYAFWAGREGCLECHHVARLTAALASGLAVLPALARRHAEQAGGDPQLVERRARINESYLRENVDYRLDEAALAGLAEFYARAAAAGILTRAPEPRFVSHAAA